MNHQASVSDLTKAVTGARQDPAASNSILRQLLFDIPGGGGSDLSREMDGIQSMKAGQPGGMDPTTMSPQELHAVLWKASGTTGIVPIPHADSYHWHIQILSFRDSVMMKIEVRRGQGCMSYWNNKPLTDSLHRLPEHH